MDVNLNEVTGIENDGNVVGTDNDTCHLLRPLSVVHLWDSTVVPPFVTPPPDGADALPDEYVYAPAEAFAPFLPSQHHSAQPNKSKTMVLYNLFIRDIRPVYEQLVSDDDNDGESTYSNEMKCLFNFSERQDTKKKRGDGFISSLSLMDLADRSVMAVKCDNGSGGGRAPSPPDDRGRAVGLELVCMFGRFFFVGQGWLIRSESRAPYPATTSADIRSRKLPLPPSSSVSSSSSRMSSTWRGLWPLQSHEYTSCRTDRSDTARV